MTHIYSIKKEVQIFPVENPWVFVSVPKKYSEELKHLADRGLVAITATVGNSSWPTSLMPMGDGSQFIPLPKKIRRAEGIVLGEKITVTFCLRKR